MKNELVCFIENLKLNNLCVAGFVLFCSVINLILMLMQLEYIFIFMCCCAIYGTYVLTYHI